MVAINSMPQQDVANGSGQIEFLRASPTTFSRLVAKKPAPSMPGGFSARLILPFVSLMAFLFPVKSSRSAGISHLYQDPDASAGYPSARRTGNRRAERPQIPSFQQSLEYPCRGN